MQHYHFTGCRSIPLSLCDLRPCKSATNSGTQGHIAQALQLNCIAPAASIKLRGRIGLYTSLLMGELGRCMMSPLIARQYRCRTAKLTRALRRCQVWWYNAVWSLPPRTTPFALLPPFGAHSGAQGLCHIACRVLLVNTTSCHVHLPVWFVNLSIEAEGESAICMFGICDATLTVYVVGTLNSGSARSCVLCIDNQAVLAALAKGSTASELGSVLAGVFWAFAARRPVYCWPEYVHTKSNDADYSSRICNAQAIAACSLQWG